MMSKTELAQKAGVTIKTINRIENNLPCRIESKRKILLGLGYKITNNWGAQAVGKYTLLVGDADDDSPVVDEGSESQFFGAVLVTYSF